jgi:hypothetical protein
MDASNGPDSEGERGVSPNKNLGIKNSGIRAPVDPRFIRAAILTRDVAVERRAGVRSLPVI